MGIVLLGSPKVRGHLMARLIHARPKHVMLQSTTWMLRVTVASPSRINDMIGRGWINMSPTQMTLCMQFMMQVHKLALTGVVLVHIRSKFEFKLL